MSIQRYDFYDDSRHCTNFTHRVASRTGDFVLFTDHLTDKECELHNLLSTLADIRTALGVGDKPMLSELAGIVRTRMGVIKILERDAKDHAAEVERLTAEHNEQMAAAYNNANRQIKELTAARDAAYQRVGKYILQASYWMLQADMNRECLVQSESARDAAISRAERAENVLRYIADQHDKGMAGNWAVNQALAYFADARQAEPSPPADASTMGGEREPMNAALQESWDKMAGIQWSEPGTPMIDRTTGKMTVVPNISERERRLVDLVRDAFMQGWDANDSDYPYGGFSYSERAEEAWERSTARAALAEMEQKS